MCAFVITLPDGLLVTPEFAETSGTAGGFGHKTDPNFRALIGIAIFRSLR